MSHLSQSKHTAQRVSAAAVECLVAHTSVFRSSIEEQHTANMDEYCVVVETPVVMQQEPTMICRVKRCAPKKTAAESPVASRITPLPPLLPLFGDKMCTLPELDAVLAPLVIRIVPPVSAFAMPASIASVPPVPAVVLKLEPARIFTAPPTPPSAELSPA